MVLDVDRFEFAAKMIRMLEPSVQAEGFKILDIRIFRGGGRSTVRIYLDGEDGITLDQCARSSRSIGILLEEADMISEAYVIEVSSPGVRRPLRTPTHFQDAVGENVILKVVEDGRNRKWKGRLLSIVEQDLTIEVEGETEAEKEIRLVPFDTIREANLDPVFDPRSLIQEDRRRKKDERRTERAARRGED